MDINPIGVAVPFFFLLIGIEYWALRRKQRSVRLNDAITDMSCGLGDQSMSLLVKGAVLIPYQLAYQHVGLFKMPTNEVWTWVFGFMAVDFCYYWYHRFSHRVNIGWATHSVHHQSEEYTSVWLCGSLGSVNSSAGLSIYRWRPWVCRLKST